MNQDDEMNDENVTQTLVEINKRLARIEKNQETMIGTLSEFSDAYRAQETQLSNHEGRIDKLERGSRDYYLDMGVH